MGSRRERRLHSRVFGVNHSSFRESARQNIPPRIPYAQGDRALILGNLIESGRHVVVELSTGITVVVLRLALTFGREKPIPVVVVHPSHSQSRTEMSITACHPE